MKLEKENEIGVVVETVVLLEIVELMILVTVKLARQELEIMSAAVEKVTQ